ncbi:cytochrome c biogenesis protein CcsA [Robbsia sp. Bb-Pol-6]|uniref:Cytochrome c biogenesis protein CcsA n=1 Tax=Robbsia betulipollinis TaxID=2981849 RepID=A0ABT3ZSI9_9BURK|nr:cytochrome c biogenesis protein CcsA [Robbsia betulipollinis]MCY0388910.1 cytochrome c biogenesis protein CcsA [Robbsia betulipollinis]
MIIVLYAVTALLYGGLSIAAWYAYRRRPALDIAGVRPVASGGAGDTPRRPSLAAGRGGVSLPAARLVLLLALFAHGALLHATIFPADSMVFGFAFSLSAMLWLGAGIYLIESFFFPLEGLGLLVLPLAGVASLLPGVFGGVRVMSYAADPLFKVHFLIANVAYGLLTLAALHAFLMLLVERRLHASRQAVRAGTGGVRGASLSVPDSGPSWLGGWLETLPPLLTMEKLLFRLISAGFVLLTLTLLSGFLFSEQLLDRLLRFDHKTVFAILSWFMFGGLVLGRRIYGWRGRAALRWVLASFLALLLAYVGSRFVLEVLLHRSVV